MSKESDRKADQAKLRKMRTILHAMARVDSALSSLDSINVSRVKNADDGFWRGSYKTKRYDRHEKTVVNDIKSAKRKAMSGQSHAHSKIARLSSEIKTITARSEAGNILQQSMRYAQKMSDYYHGSGTGYMY